MGHDAGLGGRLGVEPRGDHLALRPASGLVRDGRLRAGVLLWLADWEACREAVAGDGTVLVATRELRLRVLQPVEVDQGTVVIARATPLRRSSRNSVIEARIHREGDDTPLAYAVGSYVARRWDGPPDANPQITMTDPAVLAQRSPIGEPLDRLLGATPMPGRPGAVRIPADPELQNPQGGLSGPVVGLTAEAAVEAAAGRGSLVHDLAVAFLASGRTGPFVAHAEPLGAGTYRAEVRDEGAGVLLAAAVGVVGPV
jgi:acyl-coenzyme A thioesterase PaaI-like protein